jgi:hypothetical protein
VSDGRVTAYCQCEKPLEDGEVEATCLRCKLPLDLDDAGRQRRVEAKAAREEMIRQLRESSASCTVEPIECLDDEPIGDEDQPEG